MASDEDREGIKGAVLAELATGMSISEAARQFNINKGTVSRWKREADLPGPTIPDGASLSGEIVALSDATVAGVAQPLATQKNERVVIGEQLFRYLQQSIITLESQIVFFRDPAWLKKQSAADLAILHGVVSDKSVRLLAALQSADSDAGPDGTGS